jgi:hypothetical protein
MDKVADVIGIANGRWGRGRGLTEKLLGLANGMRTGKMVSEVIIWTVDGTASGKRRCRG